MAVLLTEHVDENSSQLRVQDARDEETHRHALQCICMLKRPISTRERNAQENFFCLGCYVLFSAHRSFNGSTDRKSVV